MELINVMHVYALNNKLNYVTLLVSGIYFNYGDFI